MTGKLLLTDLKHVPPKWTILFRGKYLSREVNLAKLLCSRKDPIIIYQIKMAFVNTDKNKHFFDKPGLGSTSKNV